LQYLLQEDSLRWCNSSTRETNTTTASETHTATASKPNTNAAGEPNATAAIFWPVPWTRCS
jgi:hypothetical protein